MIVDLVFTNMHLLNIYLVLSLFFVKYSIKIKILISIFLAIPFFLDITQESKYHSFVQNLYQKYYNIPTNFVYHNKDVLNHQCLYGIHPHGFLPHACISMTSNNIIPNSMLLVSDQSLSLSVYRFMAYLRGSMNRITKENFNKYFDQDKNIVIFPGGVKEFNMCSPNSKTIYLDISHKGFIKIAIQKGIDLVPGFCFGSNDLYNFPFKNWSFKIKSNLIMLFPYFCNKYYLPIKNNIPIRLVLGDRIPIKKVDNPSEKLVNLTHQLYYQKMKQIYYKYRDEYEHQDRELVYIN